MKINYEILPPMWGMYGVLVSIGFFMCSLDYVVVGGVQYLQRFAVVVGISLVALLVISVVLIVLSNILEG